MVYEYNVHEYWVRGNFNCILVLYIIKFGVVRGYSNTVQYSIGILVLFHCIYYINVGMCSRPSSFILFYCSCAALVWCVYNLYKFTQHTHIDIHRE